MELRQEPAVNWSDQLLLFISQRSAVCVEAYAVRGEGVHDMVVGGGGCRGWGWGLGGGHIYVSRLLKLHVL